jgi:hypothetical protein
LWNNFREVLVLNATHMCLRATVDSDRKSSLAVAVKSLLVRKESEHALNQSVFFQFTSRPVPVNGLLRSGEGSGFGAVHLEPVHMESRLFQ